MRLGTGKVGSGLVTDSSVFHIHCTSRRASVGDVVGEVSGLAKGSGKWMREGRKEGRKEGRQEGESQESRKKALRRKQATRLILPATAS